MVPKGAGEATVGDLGSTGPRLQPLLPREGSQHTGHRLHSLFPTLAAPGIVRGSVTTPEGRRSAIPVVPAQDPCPASVLFVETGKGPEAAQSTACVQRL